MTILRNKSLVVLTGMFAFAVPAHAQNYDYLSRSDFISLSAGDAPAANIAIQTPTPWPYYVNRVTIHTSGQQGLSALDKMFKRYQAKGDSAPTTVINVGPQQ
jgi:hypothetical protein